MDGVKIGVLAGSLLSTLFGYFLLLIFSRKWLTKKLLE
jgi:NhaA family Na+:H+ antiporter